MGQSTLSAYFHTETLNGTIMLPISSAGPLRMARQRHQATAHLRRTSNREPSSFSEAASVPVQSLLTS